MSSEANLAVASGRPPASSNVAWARRPRPEHTSSRVVRHYGRDMRVLVVGVVLAVVLSMSACGSDDSSSDATTETSLGADVPDIVGDTVDDATATLAETDLTLRIVRLDGEDLPATADYVPTRVNVAVETQDDGSEVVTEVVSVG
jgi:hypothetical protein